MPNEFESSKPATPHFPLNIRPRRLRTSGGISRHGP